MVRMYPQEMQDRKSAAEVKLFDLFSAALPDDYTVLHSVRWLQKVGNRKARDGETDFILLSPKKGLLLLEVKGGEIAFSAETGRWASRDRAGDLHMLSRSPFDQVKDSKFNLREYLRSLPNWNKNWGPLCHAVSFPDAHFDSAPLPDTPRTIILDAFDVRDADTLRKRIDQIFDFYRGPIDHFDQIAVETARSGLAHDIVIRQPLSVVAEESDREIIRLSERQFGLLNFLAGHRRAAISGPAGSGKTLLAAEKARRLAEQGTPSLLTCFSRPLADFLRESIDEDSLTVTNFHSLCLRLADNIELPYRQWDSAGSTFWHEIVNALVDAIDSIDTRFDAIIVDEGQDFDETWWILLSLLLTDPDEGLLYVFFDGNQLIYRRPAGLPENLLPFQLFENWRNTRQVFDYTMSFYKGEDIVCAGPEGVEVIQKSVPAWGQKRAVTQLLSSLIKKEGFAPSDVVVLTPRAVERSGLRGKAGSLYLTDDPRSDQEVRLASIHSFKGLDAKVVVVAEVDEKSKGALDRLLYVACSRARSLLAVITSTEDAPPPS